MKWLIIGMMLIASGCQAFPKQFSLSPNHQTTKSSNSQEDDESCSPSTKVVLKAENIKSITLSDQPTTQSGIAQQKQAIGYTFTAKSGQKFSYQTNDNLCVWIYTPEQQPLNGTVLPSDGIYTVQILTPIGSRTFEIQMSLQTLQATNSGSNSGQPKPPANKPSNTPPPNQNPSEAKKAKAITKFPKTKESLENLRDELVEKYQLSPIDVEQKIADTLSQGLDFITINEQNETPKWVEAIITYQKNVIDDKNADGIISNNQDTYKWLKCDVAKNQLQQKLTEQEDICK